MDEFCVGRQEGHSSQEGNSASDWHPADILAAIKKRGLSLAGLSVANGYHPTAAGKALRRPWPALETVIAQAIGVAPQRIWPTRYQSRAGDGGNDAPSGESDPFKPA